MDVKCGAVDHAMAMFDEMSRCDVYTYASMILGLAMLGWAEEALSFFTAMWRAGVWPNGVAFLGMISVCCHGGRVKEGIRHLDKIARCYGVTPGVEHYGCAVEMLGRAGRLDEAEALAATMPVPPDALVRGSLIAACRAHSDVERAERVMRWMDNDCSDSRDHVLMSNMYAARGHHGKAVRLRKNMKEKKLEKESGCSVIGIDGVVHEFRAVPAKLHHPNKTLNRDQSVKMMLGFV